MSSSIWLANAGVKNTSPPALATYPKLQPPAPAEHYDAVVVGGGIVGCTAAYMLKNSGKKVALIEGRTIGTGTTSFSTSKLSAQQGTAYSMIAQQRGKQVARSYYDMNMQGIRKVQELVETLKLDCEYEPRSHMMWSSDSSNLSKVQSEYDVCKEIGIPDLRLADALELSKELPVSLHPQLAVCFDNQAQFNVYKFCTELAKHIPGGGCDVFEQSRVTRVEEHMLQPNKPHEVYIEENAVKITGDNIVLATHLPFMNRSLHFAILEPSRSYCIAAKIKKGKDTNMHNMFVNCDMPMRSLRMVGDDDILVVSGESHPMGEKEDTEECYTNLETWARQHYEVEEIVSRWGTFDFYSSDHVPFAGYLHRGTKSLFTATGFSKWGISLGVASAMLIDDLINERENPYHEMVDARRWDLMRQFKGISMESWHTASHLVGDKIKQAVTTKSIRDLQPGHGGVVKAGLKTVGAYRDPEGEYHVVDPVCTHLGCNLVFNQADAVWDCPCHASQFGIDGDVIQGPALKPLCQIKDIEW